MDLGGTVQELLLVLLTFDKKAGTVIRSTIKAEEFDPYYKDVAAQLYEFSTRYGEPAGEHLLDLIQDLKSKRKKSAKLYDQLYKSIIQTDRREINVEYVLGQLHKFVRYQTIKTATGEIIEHLERDDETCVERAEATMQHALQTTRKSFDPGLKLTDPQALAFFEEDFEPFPCGIEALKHVAPARKRLLLYAGEQGSGKTWAMIHLAKHAMLARLKVVHISLEMSETEMAMRYCQSLFSLSKRPTTFDYVEFEVDDHGHIQSLPVQRVPGKGKKRSSLNSEGAQGRLARKIQRGRALLNRLVIKEFPSGSIEVPDIEAFLDTLQAASGFIPDLLIVDYPDLLKLDVRHLREATGAAYKAIRGIAGKRNIATVAPTQINREGTKSSKPRQYHLAEDISKAHTADFVWIYKQTETERELGLAQIHVAKGRSDEDKFNVLISQNYRFGQFVCDSARMTGRRYYDEVLKEATGRSDDEDL